MSEHPDNPDDELRADGDDLLARATAAVWEMSVPPLPLDVAAKAAELGRVASDSRPAAVVGQMALLKSSEEPPPHPSPGVPGEGVRAMQIQTRKRVFTMKAIWKLAAAAVIAVVMGGVLFTSIGRRTNVAFADVLENVKKVRAVTFKTTTVVKMADQKEVITTGEATIVEPFRMRQVVKDSIVAIFDLQQGKMLTLDPHMHQAMLFEMGNMPKEQMPVNFLDELKKLDAKKANGIGEKIIDGKAAQGFSVTHPMQDLTLWVDKQTRLPVSVEITQHVGTMQPSTTTMSDFVWDPPVNEADFSLTPPKGYTIQSLKMNMSAPEEKDLVESLRLMAELNGSKFPTEFNFAGLGAVIKDLSENGPKRGTVEHDKLQAKILPGMLQVGRGMVFAGNSEYGSDWHYAGKDVALGQKDRAIVWYHPKGAEKYRVIFGDLHIEEVEKTGLPDVPSTVLGPMNPTAAPQK